MIVSQRKKDETRKIKVLLIGGDVIGKALRKSRQALSLSNQKDWANYMHMAGRNPGFASWPD
jgi:hypothetical protein